VTAAYRRYSRESVEPSSAMRWHQCRFLVA
jgi:hypothetical protein